MATLSLENDWIEIIGSTMEKGELVLIWQSCDRSRTGTMTVTKLLEIAPTACPF
jgi:hypothetical protein